MRKFLNITHKSLNDLAAVSYKELWTKAQEQGYEGLSLCVASAFTKAADGSKFHAVFSTDDEDRHGDVVHQDFDLRGFKRNPVFIDSHNYGSIERIIGRVQPISVKDGKLQGDIEFATENPLGALAMKLAEGGFLNTTSIGFIPREFNDKGEMLKSELLEVSAVSVPANDRATFDKKNLDDDEIETPDDPEESDDEVVTAGEDKTGTEEESGDPVDAEEQEAELDPNPETRSLNRKAIAARVVSQMAEEQKALVRGIAKAVHELTEENKQENRRKIYKAVRALLNE